MKMGEKYFLCTCLRMFDFCYYNHHAYSMKHQKRQISMDALKQTNGIQCECKMYYDANSEKRHLKSKQHFINLERLRTNQNGI